MKHRIGFNKNFAVLVDDIGPDVVIGYNETDSRSGKDVYVQRYISMDDAKFLSAKLLEASKFKTKKAQLLGGNIGYIIWPDAGEIGRWGFSIVLDLEYRRTLHQSQKTYKDADSAARRYWKNHKEELKLKE